MTDTATELTVGPLTLKLVYLREQKAQIAKAYEEQIASLEAEQRRVQHLRDLAVAGVPVDVTELALAILQLEGSVKRDNENCLYHAVEDLARGAVVMKQRYFGVKDYDRFHGQREDNAYGRGPRHGRIVFSIGLRSEARSRDLTPMEIDAACRYLLALKKGI